MNEQIELLQQANDVLRSVSAIIERKGVNTNWDGIGLKVRDALNRQHKYFAEPPKDENLMQLVPMTEFVNNIITYIRESHNYERAISLVEWYANLIQTPLSIGMFTGDSPLFPNFKIVNDFSECASNNIEKGVSSGVNGEFTVTIYGKSKSGNSESRLTYVTSFHLKTVEQLCGKGLLFSIKSEYAESDLFNV